MQPSGKRGAKKAPVIFTPDGLPLGVQIIGAPWRELNCLRVAAYLERKGIASAPVAKAFVEP